MNQNTETKSQKTTKWLVIGTWALVAASLFGSWLIYDSYKDQLKEMRRSSELIYDSYKDQLEEMRRSTDLAWRPYLHLEHIYSDTLGFSYKLGESEETDTINVRLDSIPLSSRQYLAVRRISYKISRKVYCKNNGSMPMRLKCVMPSTICKNEWEDMGKLPEKLVEKVRDLEELKNYETDVIIFAGDEFTTEDFRGFPRTLSKELFEKYLYNDSEIVLYPYTYVEYEDFFGVEYNVLYIDHTIIGLDIIDDIVCIEGSSKIGLERFRWDVLLEEQRAKQDSLDQSTL